MAKEINTNEAIDILKDSIRCVRRANNGEFIFKCPFCGDNDNPYHGHLYINPNMGVFNCYKCDMGGNINRLLYLFEGSKFRVPGIQYTYKKANLKSGGLTNNSGNFERYLNDVQIKVKMNPTFHLQNSVDQYPMYMYKHTYLMDRVIKDKSILSLLDRTNTTQHLLTYYSEHFMQRYIECGALPNSKNITEFVNQYILSRYTSLMFLGYHKTLSLFKNDSTDIKYFKIKKNIFYGEENFWDFFMIINQNKYTGSLNDLYKEKELNVYFAEGVFDALNLYLYNPKYATGVEPDIILATGSKVSYASALYFIRDTFMKRVTSHVFLDPEIRYKEFAKKYRLLKRVYNKAIFYQNGSFDYGDIKKDDLGKIKICDIMG